MTPRKLQTRDTPFDRPGRSAVEIGGSAACSAAWHALRLLPHDARASGYTITEAAEALGLTPRTLRHYEQMGLIEPSRTRGKTRRYSVSMLDKLRMVALLRRAAAPLPVIIEAFALAEPHRSLRFNDLIRSRLTEIADETDLLRQALTTLEANPRQPT